MKKLLLVAGLGLSLQAWGLQVQADDDLESLLKGEGQNEPAVSRQQSFLVDTLRSLQDSKPTAEQNAFFRLLEGAQWEKALLQYNPAFAGTGFDRSANGRALSAYLKFKSGLTTLGVEELFTATEPKKIHFYLLNLWKEVAPEGHPAWTVSVINWTPEWSEFFGVAFEVKAKIRQVTHKQGLEDLKDLVKRAPSDSKERGLAEWNLAVALALNDQADQAAKVIAYLMKSKNSPVSEDLLNLTAARLLFQNGYFEAAIRYYDKIKKSSDYWLEAQEEIAWSYIRKGESQNALAVTQTLVNPVFKGQVGSEPYFVRVLAQLKICDYPGVVKGLQQFSPQFKGRTLALNKLAEEGGSAEATKMLNTLKVKDLTWNDLGKDAQALPRFTTRDQRLKNLARAQAELEREAAVAETLYAKSLGQTGLQASFEQLRQGLLNRAMAAKSATMGRLQEIARAEVAEIRKILDKMHIVEAEVIQQTSLADKLAKASTATPDVKKGTTGSKARDTLTFISTGGDVWFDELSNYRIDVKKACQVKKE